MALDSVLASIPGYGGFAAKRQMNLQEERAGLQDVATKMGLLAKLQEEQAAKAAAAKEAEYRAALEGLGPEATPEQQVQVASRYVGPEKLLTIQQGAADKAAQRQIMVQAANDRRDQQQQLIEMRYDALAQTAANEEQRRALEARRLEETERNNKRHDETLRLLGQIRAGASQQPKPPPGFRYKTDGSGDLEAIPGGPKDTSQKDTARAKGAIQKADTVIAAVDEAMTQTGSLTTGLPGQILGMVPGTSAYDLDGTLDTIKANLGFAELQAMRDASPTGGALGQVAIQELAMLQATLASLKRGLSRPKLEAGLKKVREHMANWKKAVADSMAESQGAPATPGGTQQTPPAPATPVAPPSGSVAEFATEAEAAAAAAAGQIKAGDKIRVGGQTGTWR